MTTISPDILALQEHLAGRYSIETELGVAAWGSSTAPDSEAFDARSH